MGQEENKTKSKAKTTIVCRV